MSPAVIRPLLHTIHLLTFAVLFVTGLLLFIPNLRAAVTGGYSLLIRDVHRWGGLAFAALPATVVLRYGARGLAAVPDVWTLRTWWQLLHVVVTVVMGVLLTATGAVLWAMRDASLSIVDVSHTVHDALTYAAGGLLAVHLVEIGFAALVGRIKAATVPAHRSQT